MVSKPNKKSPKNNSNASPNSKKLSKTNSQQKISSFFRTKSSSSPLNSSTIREMIIPNRNASHKIPSSNPKSSDLLSFENSINISTKDIPPNLLQTAPSILPTYSRLSSQKNSNSPSSLPLKKFTHYNPQNLNSDKFKNPIRSYSYVNTINFFNPKKHNLKKAISNDGFSIFSAPKAPKTIEKQSPDPLPPIQPQKSIKSPKSNLVWVDITKKTSKLSFDALNPKDKNDLVLCDSYINIPLPNTTPSPTSPKPPDQSDIEDELLHSSVSILKTFNLDDKKSDTVSNGKVLPPKTSNSKKNFLLNTYLSDSDSDGELDIFSNLPTNKSSSSTHLPSFNSGFLDGSANNRKTLAGILSRHKKRKKQLDIFNDLSTNLDISSSDEFQSDYNSDSQNHPVSKLPHHIFSNSEKFSTDISSSNENNSSDQSTSPIKKKSKSKYLKRAMLIFSEHFKNSNSNVFNFNFLKGFPTFNYNESNSPDIDHILSSATNTLSRSSIFTNAYLGNPIDNKISTNLLFFILFSNRFNMVSSFQISEAIKILKLHCSIVKDLPESDIFSPSQLFNTLSIVGLKYNDFGYANFINNGNSSIDLDQNTLNVDNLTTFPSNQIVVILELYALSFQSFLKFRIINLNKDIEFLNSSSSPKSPKSKKFKRKIAEYNNSILDKNTISHLLNSLMTILNVLMDPQMTHKLHRLQNVLLSFVECIPEIFWSEISISWASLIIKSCKHLDTKYKLLLISERIPSFGKLAFLKAKLAFAYLSEQDSPNKLFINYPDILNSLRIYKSSDMNTLLLVYLNKIKDILLNSKYFSSAPLKSSIINSPTDKSNSVYKTHNDNHNININNNHNHTDNVKANLTSSDNNKGISSISNINNHPADTIPGSPHFELFFGIKLITILLSPNLFMPFIEYSQNISAPPSPTLKGFDSIFTASGSSKSTHSGNHTPMSHLAQKTITSNHLASESVAPIGYSYLGVMNPIHSRLLALYRKLGSMKPNDACLSDIKDSLNLVCVWLSMTWLHKDKFNPVYSSPK
ncbi:hypothetical protein AYI70_g4389 [Smittium culicis]|uniref:Uncharacterized protein n=1 Tax=Smittium culicis TaxID=133412 RepID=A0A1R1XZA9_9FUNG|nr:hypothetical protein AYI70_g4389 [Smittium culicis]